MTFAINTELRLGEILNLKWEEVDLENAVIKMLVRKNRRMLEVLLNDCANVNMSLQPRNWRTVERPLARAEEGRPSAWMFTITKTTGDSGGVRTPIRNVDLHLMPRIIHNVLDDLCIG